MPAKEIQRVPYPCSKLGKNAHLVLGYLKRNNKRFLTEFDCENCQECEVGKEGPRGSWSFNWDICPAYKEMK